MLKKIIPSIQETARTRPTVWLALILLLAACLRVYDLGKESYWIDEMYTVVEGQQSITHMLASGRLDQPPAYYLPFSLWLQAFGLSEFATRMFSCLAGVASIYLVYLIAGRLFNPTVALLASFISAASEFQIYYAQQARFYAFFELAALVSIYTFLLAISGKRSLPYVLHALAGLWMLYAHSYGVFILLAQSIYFLLNWKKYPAARIPWLLSQLAIWCFFLPYFLPLVFGQGLSQAVTSNSTQTPPPSWLDSLKTLFRFVFPARRGRAWDAALINTLSALLILLVGIAWQRMRQGWLGRWQDIKARDSSTAEYPDLRGSLLFTTLWLVVPLALPFFASLAVAPMYLDRYMIASAPAMALLIAFALFHIRRLLPLMFSIAAFMVMVAPGLVYYYRMDVHEQWREAAAYLHQNLAPHQALVFAPNEGIGIEKMVFEWYYQQPVDACGLQPQVEPAAISATLSQCLPGHSMAWVIIRGTPPMIAGFHDYFFDPNRTQFHLVQQQLFQGLYLYLFQIKPLD